MVDYLNHNYAAETFNDSMERQRQQRIQDEDRQRRIAAEDQARAQDEATRQGVWQGLEQARAQQQAAAQPAASAGAPQPVQAQPVAAGAPAPAAMAPTPAPARPSPLTGVHADYSDPVLEALLRQGPAAAGAAMQRATALQQQATQERQHQDALEDKAITALAADDLQTYTFFAQKAGMPPLPPQILQNADQRRLFAAGSKAAQAFYGNDPQQAQAYVVAFLKSGGDPMAAFQAAGAPRSSGQYSVHTIVDGQNRILAQVDALRGTARPIVNQQTGQPVNVPSTGSGSGVPAQVQTVQWVMDNMKLSPGDAWQLVNMAKQNPMIAYSQVWRAVYKAKTDSGFGDEGDATAAADEAARAFLQSMGVTMPGAMLQGGQPQPAPAAGQPQAAAPPKFRYNPQTGGFDQLGG